MTYIHDIHTWHTYMTYIHDIHTWHTWHTYMTYIHDIHTWHTYMTYIHTYIHACMHASMHTYIHTYIIYIYMYIYINKCTDIHIELFVHVFFSMSQFFAVLSSWGGGGGFGSGPGSGFDVKVMPEDLERVQALARPGSKWHRIELCCLSLAALGSDAAYGYLSFKCLEVSKSKCFAIV